MSGLIQDGSEYGTMRAEPVLPVEAVQTYQIIAPHRPAHCAEMDHCEHYEHGWSSAFDESTELGRNQAAYVRSRSGRRFREDRTEAGLTRFTFYPGQRCFAPHQLPSAGERFLRRGGDWRGNPLGDRYEFTRPDDWVDSFATNLDQVQTAKERG